MAPDPVKMRALLEQHEGLSIFPYRDPVDPSIITVGIGHNLTAKGLPMFIIAQLFDADLAEAWADLVVAHPWVRQLDEVRQAVLLDMAFNMGAKHPRRGLLSFKSTLALIERGDYVLAADYMLRSKWARQVGGRARRLAEMMRTGYWNK